ncbi:DUF86 domain-containing protein [Nocardia salmonicida]|uniref:HepT-like ribonuclease domain-containing protein n=1 Tax=Nocardia salmonicida TaxID=53431 RepID=UPI0033ED6E8C
MKQREERYLADIVLAAYQIATYLRDISRADFATDRLRQDAVVRQLEIIGEASSALSDATRADHPDIPWRDVRGMRNRLAHAYFDIDVELVYDTATRSAPDIAEAVFAIVAELHPAEVERILANKPAWLD